MPVIYCTIGVWRGCTTRATIAGLYENSHNAVAKRGYFSVEKDRNGSIVDAVRVDADRHSAIALGRLGKTSAVIRTSNDNFQ
jgi:hypothetical protein